MAAHVERAKLPVQRREYSADIFNAKAAAKRKEKVVAKTTAILSINASGRVTASNSYRPEKFISIMEMSQTNAIAAA
jgi:hypothetical protein